jgi:hypothetical protein
VSKKLTNSPSRSLRDVVSKTNFAFPKSLRVAILPLPGPHLQGTNVETIGGAENLALRLFFEIKRRYGEDEARRIFECSKKRTPSELAEAKSWELLDRYDNMQPKPNVMELARQLALENNSPRGEAQPLQRSTTTSAN